MSHPPPAPAARRPGAETESPATPGGGAAGFLLSRGVSPESGTRSILLGFGVLLLLGALALNVWLWSSARSRSENDGWARLEASADMRRDQIAFGLATFRREALNLAEGPLVARVAPEFVAGRLGSAERQAFETEIVATQRHFQFENVQIIRASGEVIYEASPSLDPERRAVDRLVTRALAAGQDVIGDPLGDELLLAVPLPSAAGAEPAAIVVHTIGDRFLSPELARWPGLGNASGAYLVRSDGDRATVLTELAERFRLQAGQSVPLQSRQNLATTMAATGVESRVEFVGGDGRSTWAVTRALPTVGWGLVALADRDEVLAGLRDTTRGLVMLDIALLLGLLSIAVMWRRLYRHGLTRQAVEITSRHARQVQAVLDNAFDAIVTFDRDGRVVTVNRAAERLFGREPGELEGQPVARFLHWGARLPASLPAAGSVGVGVAVDRQEREIQVEYSLSASHADEQVFTAIVRDVSERAEAERRIRSFAEGLEITNHQLEEANAQLEEASRLKSEFLANTSHELRTPLNGMLGFLQLVLDGMCDSREEELDFLRQALACSRHLLGLINDVLDIAKIESGKLALEVVPLDIGHLLDEVRTLTHVQASQRDLQLAFETELEEGITARGDFGKVKQVLINLVGNSLKFTHQGSISVRVRTHSDLGYVMFEIVDTGIGIPPTRQEAIFEKFVQGDGSTTRRYGGTGLGLAISRSLIEMMGGIIGVQSEGEGHGTRMYFSLPVWRSAPLAALSEAVISGPDGAALVLVVEDDPVFRRFVAAVLHPRGYRTIEAASAEEGWAILQSHTPACVVLDYALSCSDGALLRTGWDLAQRMSSQPATRHVPLVFVTGFDGELQLKLRSTAFARHPEHLVKPISADALIARIDALAGESAGHAVRVLLADDDASVSSYVLKTLPRDRFSVHVVRDGEECLHALRTDPGTWDVLLLDLMMPGVSGYDVLREMTLAGLRPDLPVLVLTNFPEPRTEEERRLLEHGLVVEVLAKSAVHSDPRVLAEILDRYRGRRPEAAGKGDPGEWREAA